MTAPAKAKMLGSLSEPMRSEAERFLAALTGSPDASVTFQTFDDDKKRRSPGLARVLHGSLSEHWSELAALNAAGAGVFVMVNDGDGKGRAEKNVRGLRALFVDDDSRELEPAALEFAPSIIVRSKNGLHAYWRLRPGESLNRFESAQTALAATLRTDTSVKDLPRVMRVPGFLHRKNPEPFLVQVVQTTDATYSIAEVLEAFGISLPTDQPPRRNGPLAESQASSPETFQRARRYLRKVPPAIEGEHGDDHTYRVAAVLVVDFQLSDDQAFTLLQEWNQTCAPRWSNEDLRRFIAHALKYGKHAPGSKTREPPQEHQSKAAQPASKTLFLPVTDFFAQCDQRVDYLLEPFIIKGGFVLVIAAPKAGKTFFVSWLAAAVAATGKRVLVVEEEGPREVLRDRLAPFLAPSVAAFKDTLYVAHREGFRLDDKHSVDALIGDAKTRRAELLVLDPFVQLHGRDENEQSQMAMVVQALQRIISETSAAIVLVHHTKKGDSWDKSSSAEAKSSDVRGSGVLVGAADSVIALKGVPRAERREGQVRFYLENTDTRVGAPFVRKLAVVKLNGGAGSLEFVEPSAGAQATLERLLPHIPYPPDVITVEDLRKAAGIAKGTVQEAVALGMGKLIARREGKRGGLYRLKDDGLVRDSLSQSATSRTADSDSSRESAIRSAFNGLDRHQRSGGAEETPTQRGPSFGEGANALGGGATP